jgi:hypothetical protein
VGRVGKVFLVGFVLVWVAVIGFIATRAVPLIGNHGHSGSQVPRVTVSTVRGTLPVGQP